MTLVERFAVFLVALVAVLAVVAALLFGVPEGGFPLPDAGATGRKEVKKMHRTLLVALLCVGCTVDSNEGISSLLPAARGPRPVVGDDAGPGLAPDLAPPAADATAAKPDARPADPPACNAATATLLASIVWTPDLYCNPALYGRGWRRACVVVPGAAPVPCLGNDTSAPPVPKLVLGDCGQCPWPSGGPQGGGQ